MRRFLQAVTLCMLALLPVSCVWQQKAPEKEQKKQAPPPLYLGSVHQVYPGSNEALLRIIGPMPSAGSTLIAHPANGSTERIGNLCVTSDKPTSNGFIMATLRSGVVMRGDRVFVYRDLSEVEEQEEAEQIEGDLADLIPDLPSNTEVEATEPHEPEPVVSTPVPTSPVHTGKPSSEPSSPVSSGKTKPVKAPSYLDNIPNNINDWD